MNNPIPPEWRSYVTMLIAGLFGSIATIPSVKLQAVEQFIFYLLTGCLCSVYLSPYITDHTGLNGSASAFLCGSFGGSVISKIIELIRSVRAQDVIGAMIAVFSRKGE